MTDEPQEAPDAGDKPAGASNPAAASRTPTHASRIVRIRRIDVLFVGTLLFILLTLIPHWTVQLGALVLLAIGSTLVILARKETRFSGWLALLTHNVHDRLDHNRLEIILLPGMVAVALLRLLAPPAWRAVTELATYLLTIAAFWLSTRSPGIRYALNPSSVAYLRLDVPPELEASEDEATAAFTAEELAEAKEEFERSQRGRWEGWLEDEMRRLGDK